MFTSIIFLNVCIHIYQGYWPLILFSYSTLIWLSIRLCLPHKINLEVFFVLLFGRFLEVLTLIPLQRFASIHLWSHLVLGFIVLKILITDLITLHVICLFIFSITSWFTPGKLYVYKNLSNSSTLSKLLHYCSQKSLKIFCVSEVVVIMFPLSFII